MLPQAHPGPNPKRHPDWFSRFCTAHGRYCYILQLAAPFPRKIASFRGDLDLHLMHDSLGPSELTTQVESRLVQSFLHSSPQSVPILHSGPPLPVKISHCHGISGPPSNKWFLGPTRVHNQMACRWVL